MTTLISTYSSEGKRTQRCDAHCYNAQGEKCTCACGGANHGKGLEQATVNTREMAGEIVKAAMGQGEHIKFAFDVLNPPAPLGPIDPGRRYEWPLPPRAMQHEKA